MSKYLLKKGNHYASGLHFGVHFGITEQKYKINLSKECLYKQLDRENDYNKLCGWSYGMHHKNSIRLCWRPYYPSTVDVATFIPELIEVCIYTYQNGVRVLSDNTLLILPETDYNLTVVYVPKAKYISLGVLPSSGPISSTKTGTIVLSNTNITKHWGYRLYPFFGGNEPSPHDMDVSVTRL